MKVIIALPVPMPFMAEVEKHLAEKRLDFRGWIPQWKLRKLRKTNKKRYERLVEEGKRKRFEWVSPRDEYGKRFEWIPKAYWRITIALFNNVDAADAGLLAMAVKQAAVAFKQILITSNGLSTQPVEDPHLGSRRIVGLEIDKGKTGIIQLAEKIDEALAKISKETGRSFCNKIKRPFTPYLALIRRGGTTRSLSTDFARETIFKPPLECVLKRIIVNISSGKDYRLQKLVKLRHPPDIERWRLNH
ncbi:MAG: hypothetical protein LBG57_02805 [Treponema sp.]|nr:hypothetical protein [Treponema sp.]